MTPELLDPLGDGISRFGIVDHMGSDRLIAEAAWVEEPGSTRGENKSEVDRIVRFMMRNEHTSPYYHPQVCMYWKVPIFVLRQADRHQVGFSWPRNEESRRYMDAGKKAFEFYLPETWRGRSPTRKQGSEGVVDLDTDTYEWLHDHVGDATELYHAMIDNGVAPEMARMHMPLSMYTSFYVTASLWAILHFMNLRDSDHAQWEVRQYALAMKSLVQPLFPATFQAWETGRAHQREE